MIAFAFFITAAIYFIILLLIGALVLRLIWIYLSDHDQFDLFMNMKVLTGFCNESGMDGEEKKREGSETTKHD